jgi:tetratricopeptide (TPR) repeat protein
VLLSLRSHGRHPPEAEILQREALAVQTDLFPEGNDDVFLSLNNLGTIVMVQNRLTEAEAIHREALTLSQKLYGAEHPDVATAMARLGRVLKYQNKLSEAEPWLRDGFLMRRKFLGSDHDYVYSALRAYEDTLTLQGKFAEAENLLRQHLALSQKTEPNPQTAYSLERLTIALLGQAKMSEAEGIRRKAVAMRQAVALKAAESSDAQVLHEPAHWLATCEEAAFRDGPRAVRMAEKAALVTGRHDPFILATLAAAYAEVGQFEMAVSVQKEALGLLADANQAADFSSRLNLYLAHQPCRDSDFMIEVANSIAGAVFNLLRQGKAAEAEKPARACLALLDQVVPDDWRTFNTRSLLGGSLLSQKKYAEAEPLLLSGCEGMKQREDWIPAAERVRLKEGIELVVRLYKATGQLEKAAEWNKKLVEFDQARAEM